ncbi:MAG: PDZ domain-containing protein [bacterium]
MKNYSSKLLPIILLSSFFGLAGGVVGAIFERVYVLEKDFNIPFMGEIDFLDSARDGSRLVISNPKKVVVEQDTKILETANSVKNNIVGIFKKLPVSPKTNATGTVFNINNYYKIEEPLGQGFIITGDGWMMTDFIPKDLRLTLAQNGETKSAAMVDYVAITADRKIYEIDNIVMENEESLYSFWHMKASGLPVKEFVSYPDINNGQGVVVLNWNQDALFTSILRKESGNIHLVQSSDSFSDKIILSLAPSKNFGNGYILSLSGALVGFVDKNGQVDPIDNHKSLINSLLKFGKIERPVLGVNYIDLSKLADASKKLPEKGALIAKDDKGIAVVKNSPAESAGLREGDVIVSVNNVELDENNSLNQIIASFLFGDEVNISYLRGTEKNTVTVKLSVGE